MFVIGFWFTLRHSYFHVLRFTSPSSIFSRSMDLSIGMLFFNWLDLSSAMLFFATVDLFFTAIFHQDGSFNRSAVFVKRDSLVSNAILMSVDRSKVLKYSTNMTHSEPDDIFDEFGSIPYCATFMIKMARFGSMLFLQIGAR